MLATGAAGAAEPPDQFVVGQHQAGLHPKRHLLAPSGGPRGQLGRRPGRLSWWRATHPEPTAAVTAFATATAGAAGLGWRTVLVAGAVLAGQASVGWCNDSLDAPLDRLTGRSAKPLAGGELAAPSVAAAAVTALAVAVGLGFGLGVRAGAVNLLALATAWSYNAGLKATALSFLPYLVAFSLVPAVFVAVSLPGAPLPAWQLALGAGVVGLGGHFANTVPDAAVDALTGVRGLPQRLGPAGAATAAAPMVTGGGVLLAWGSGWPAAMLAAVAAAGVLSGATAVAAATGRRRRSAFRAVLLAAGVVVVGFVATGAPHLAG